MSAPLTRRTRLVIFDCDGVLVDSEVISNEVLAEVVTELGWPQTLDDALRRFKGLAMPDIWQIVAAELGTLIPEAVDRDFRRRQLHALRTRVQPVPGIRELLADLPVPFCVASNGPPEKMEATLGSTGLLPWFEGRLFSRMEVSRPKPFPDLFLHAARCMNAPPTRTLVVEDSPLGVRAARTAGMRVLGFVGTVTADSAELLDAGAECVLEDVREVAHFL